MNKLTKVETLYVPVTSPLDKADTFYSVHNGSEFKDWVQKQNNKYILDEYELRKIIIDAMNIADKYDYTLQSDKDQYINSILNK